MNKLILHIITLFIFSQAIAQEKMNKTIVVRKAKTEINASTYARKMLARRAYCIRRQNNNY